MKKLITRIVSIVLLTGYVITVFYLSEPKYINYADGEPQTYDYISVNKDGYSDEVINGIVVQRDSTYFLVKLQNYYDDFHQLKINSEDYRIIGKGTIYHRVNEYLGFNIMNTTQVIIVLLLVILILKTLNIHIDL